MKLNATTAFGGRQRLGARRLIWLLAVVVVLVPERLFEKRYHCRMTGARDLLACCCETEAECGPESSDSCESGSGCASQRADEADDCSCCEVTYQASRLRLAPASKQTPIDEAVTPALAAAESPWCVAEVRLAPRGDDVRPRAGPPLYLVCQILLI